MALKDPKPRISHEFIRIILVFERVLKQVRSMRIFTEAAWMELRIKLHSLKSSKNVLHQSLRNSLPPNRS